MEENEQLEKNKSTILGKIWKVIRTLLVILVTLSILVTAAGVVFVFCIIKDAPEIDTSNVRALLSENSIIYDDKGNVLDSVFLESKRTNVNYSSLPENLKNAFIAVEDKTFWKHHGFNVNRILGAVIEGLKSGEKISGTSTITQQLARNLYLMDVRSEYSINRKVIEAYYAVLLEKDLTKKQILEAYLNRISLGFGTSGVQAAAQGYFSKDVEALTLPECVALAAIVQEPNAYSLIKTLPNASVQENNENILYRDSTYTYLYNAEASAKRRNLILRLMKEQGYITQKEYNEAIGENLREYIKPHVASETENASSYFTDFAIREVVEDLAEEFDCTEEKAWDMLFNGGLRIYTTLDSSVQGIIETAFAKNENFPGVANLSRDRAGNILKPGGGILLYAYDKYFDATGEFVIKPEEYTRFDDGTLMLYTGKRLNFYKTESRGQTDYNINFKSMYTRENNSINTISEGVVKIPPEYKYKDKDGNLIIEAVFFKDYPDFFTETKEGLAVSAKNYSLNQKVVQPQAAMVVINYETGEIKAMLGGRGTEGRLLYNRAANPRQPGSSIKPIAVYGPALQSSADEVSGAKEYAPKPIVQLRPEIFFSGKYWTAASVINDAPLFLEDKPWPKNWYQGNRGPATLRGSLEQSINVNAVKVFSQIGPDISVDFLKKVGITSIVETGSTNDINAAALALGGMTKGISPLEMAAAYSTFANGGRYNTPKAYTKVTNRKGEILLSNNPENRQVIDSGVAFIMTDILRTTVSSGIARSASVSGRTVAGKTGTTSDNYDAWFVGFSAGYAASLWIGNDIKIELNEGSMSAARLWSRIMTMILDGKPDKAFLAMPENIVKVSGEYFIEGTQENSFHEIMPFKDEEEAESEDGEAMNTDAGDEDITPENPRATNETPDESRQTVTPEITPPQETKPPPEITPSPKPEEPPPVWLFPPDN